MKQKIVAVILLLILIAGMSCTAFAVQDTPGYIIRASADGSTVTVGVAIEHASATVGRFALGYDKEKVALLDKNGSAVSEETDPALSAIIDVDASIKIPPQNQMDGQCVSMSKGLVMFSWYASGTRVEALEQEKTIANIYFQLKEGVTEEDFNAVTFKMYTLQDGEYAAWKSGAYLSTGSFDHYWNNVDGYRQCGVTKEYRNSDVMPIYLYAASFTVQDAAGAAVGNAAVRVNETDYETDGAGKAAVMLPSGRYGYTVSKDGYESKSGIVTIADGDAEELVTIRSDMQFVTQQLETIEITFAEGESADEVRTSFGLPLWETEDIKLTWKSSNPEVVTDAGAVITPKTDTSVTMTASLSKGGATAERSYALTVLSEPAKPSSSADTTRPSGGGTTTGNPGTTPAAGGTEVAAPNGEPGNPADPSASQKMPEFTDINAYPWARDAILLLAKEGIIKGTSETTFAPAAKIKRGDFVTLLVRMFELEAAESGNSFVDVPKDSYYYHEIAAAKAMGIAMGTDESHFDPESSITRQDMMVITMRAMELREVPITVQAEKTLESYADAAQIAAYAYESVGRLVGAGLIAGNENGEIQPGGITTRAEVAVFLGRIYQIR